METGQTLEDLSSLIALVHRRWNIPVLAELHRTAGAKFVSLANALDVSRASLSASLNDLIDLGLVARNTGHGHPMRPEYLLTDRGREPGEFCYELMQGLRTAPDVDLGLRKWTLPIVATIGEDVRRFSEVKNALGDATPRAITLALKAMSERNWLRRTLIDDYPPTAGYALKPKGRRILENVRRLQRA
ncbi:MAG: winged helix-turn-helix transcriptional regulator [Woeseiaceae bacterium]|nr:winged helix-turn-helix transcriptional regulator [Woeseiaceae bacterium]